MVVDRVRREVGHQEPHSCSHLVASVQGDDVYQVARVATCPLSRIVPLVCLERRYDGNTELLTLYALENLLLRLPGTLNGSGAVPLLWEALLLPAERKEHPHSPAGAPEAHRLDADRDRVPCHGVEEAGSKRVERVQLVEQACCLLSNLVNGHDTPPRWRPAPAFPDTRTPKPSKKDEEVKA